MTTTITELYDMLIAAGAPEDKARKAAEVVASYECADCGLHIFDIGRDTPPADRRCGVCRWIVDYIPAEE